MIADKRRHTRHLFFHRVEYRGGSRTSEDVCHGSILNISEFGMCMYTDRPLDAGEHIEIMNALPVPYQKATIRWAAECFHDLYKIGLAFIDQYANPLRDEGDLNLGEHNQRTV